MRLCIIPARGGSKRIPRKNIKEFCGKPIIAWSIEAARNSGCFDHIIVSTDDEEIGDISKIYGAEVPFKRPLHLADDYTSTSQVIEHAIQWSAQNIAKPENVCCIYATAPFIQFEDINRALDLLLHHRVDFVFPVTTYAFPIQRAIKITPDQRVEMFQPECFNMRSQDFEPAWHDAGQFYWGKSEAWLARKTLFNSDAMTFVLPRYRVQDIDTPEDWMCAELMFSAKLGVSF